MNVAHCITRWASGVLFMGLTFSVGCVGLPDGTTGAVVAARIAELEEFAWEAPFPTEPEGAWPIVPKAPDNLLRFCRDSYAHEPAVRRLIAVQFLRYDSALLMRGLITCQAGEKTLIALLWEKEARGWEETPSMFMMRRHIGEAAEWFALDSKANELLRKNESMADDLVEFWSKARSLADE